MCETVSGREAPCAAGRERWERSVRWVGWTCFSSLTRMAEIVYVNAWINFQKDGPFRWPNESEPRLTPGYKPGKDPKVLITNQEFWKKPTEAAEQTDEWSDDDFQQDRDPRRGEERPRSPHGIPPADAITGAQPGDQVHQGRSAPFTHSPRTLRAAALLRSSEPAAFLQEKKTLCEWERLQPPTRGSGWATFLANLPQNLLFIMAIHFSPSCVHVLSAPQKNYHHWVTRERFKFHPRREVADGHKTVSFHIYLLSLQLIKLSFPLTSCNPVRKADN